MNMKTILGWVAVAFVAWFVIMQPHAATQIVRNIGHFMTSAAHGLSHLFASI